MPQTNRRRTQKVYADVMGRVKQTEIWDLNGASLYSTTVNSYNARDQVVRLREITGASGTQQDTTFEFDGHGRLQKSHKPEWFDSSNNPTYTTLAYNTDDTVAVVTDPRGATTAYKYGNVDDAASGEYRRLLTKITYSSPDTTNIHAPGDVNFVYDPAGNRKSMSDDSGTLTYTFNELSRLASETKVFADTLANAPSGGYKLEYSYHLSGGIKAVKDPHSTNGWEVTYTSDRIGRTNAVGAASGFGSVSSFATNIGYRAFGGVKSMTYSTTQATNISLTYDNRLRPIAYEAESSANTTDIHNKTYSYNNDGSIKQATNTLEADYTQTYEYDFTSRLKKNEMGGTSGPYKQTLGYDEFDHLTSRSTTFDGTTRSFTSTYENNRKKTGGYGEGDDTFDVAGNVVQNIASNTPLDLRSWKYDAAGRVSEWREVSHYGGITHQEQSEIVTFDGDGRAAKRSKRAGTYSIPTTLPEAPAYSIYSSVLGKPVAELDPSGQWQKRNIYFNGTAIAEQTSGWGVRFMHTDPVAGSEMKTEASGEVLHPEIGRIERAALGEVIPTVAPEVQLPPHDYRKGTSPFSNPDLCGFNGAMINCGRLKGILGSILGLFESKHLAVVTVRETWREQFAVSVIQTGTERGFRITDVSDSWWILTDVQVSMEMIEIPGVIYSDWAANLSRSGETNPGFIVHMPHEQKLADRIREIAYYARDSKKCAEAFRAAGATPVGEQIDNTTIVTESVFNDDRHDPVWTMGSDIGEAMRDSFPWRSTTNDLSWPGPYKDTERRFIGITNRAARETDDHLSVSVIHSFIHSGNVPGQDISTWWQRNISGNVPHDLKFLGEKYKDILKHCTREGKSKALWGQ